MVIRPVLQKIRIKGNIKAVVDVVVHIEPAGSETDS
jgi:hypothetical protein